MSPDNFEITEGTIGGGWVFCSYLLRLMLLILHGNYEIVLDSVQKSI